MQVARNLCTIANLLIAVSAVEQAERMRTGAESLMRRETSAVKPGDVPNFKDGDFEAATIQSMPGGEMSKTYLLAGKYKGKLPPGWQVNCPSGTELVPNNKQNGKHLVETGPDDAHSGVFLSMSKKKGKFCRIAQVVNNFRTDGTQYLVTFQVAYYSGEDKHKPAHKKSNYGGRCRCPNGKKYDVGVPLNLVKKPWADIPCTLKDSCIGGKPRRCGNIRGRIEAIEKKERREKTAYTVECAKPGKMRIETNGGKILVDGAVDYLHGNRKGMHYLSIDPQHKNLEDVAFVMQPDKTSVFFGFDNMEDDTQLYVDKFEIIECKKGGSKKNGKHNIQSCEGFKPASKQK
jgi:hypothetical protein